MTDNTIAESDQAKRNTEIVVTAMRELFVEKDLTALDRYWAEPYVQHSPQMPNGLDTPRCPACRGSPGSRSARQPRVTSCSRTASSTAGRPVQW